MLMLIVLDGSHRCKQGPGWQCVVVAGREEKVVFGEMRGRSVNDLLQGAEELKVEPGGYEKPVDSASIFNSLSGQ